jgi:hypothetical protein
MPVVVLWVVVPPGVVIVKVTRVELVIYDNRGKRSVV